MSLDEAELYKQLLHQITEAKHYGIWSDKYEAWWRLDGPLFMADSYALALFQLQAVPDMEWRVRCIEEWADGQ